MSRSAVGQSAPEKTKPCAAPSPPFISAIVPVRNEAAFIKRTLEQLLAQHYDPARFEVIVVDGQSTDATREIVAALQAVHPNLKLYGNPKCLSSAARNIGIHHARGDLLVFIDGHCDVRNENYLRDVSEAFARSGADCVGRPQPLDVPGATPLQQAIAAARSCWLGHHPDSHIYSAKEQFVPPHSVAIAYRRSVFEKVGLFDEQFDACEDVELNHRVHRASLCCFFTPKARVHYYPRSSLRGLFWQLARYGRGRIRLLRKHPETFSLPCFVPAAFALGLVAGPAFAWYSSVLAAVYAGTLALYALLVVTASLLIVLRSRKFRLLPWLPVVFLTIHLGSGYGVIREQSIGWARHRTPPRL